MGNRLAESSSISEGTAHNAQAAADATEQAVVFDFVVGERVWRRDHGQPWGTGFIASVHPLRVTALLDCSATGWKYDAVRKQTSWSKRWGNLTHWEVNAAEVCGWTANTWDGDDDLVIHGSLWKDLPLRQRDALELLGCTQEIWDDAEARVVENTVVGQVLNVNVAGKRDELQVDITNIGGAPLREGGFTLPLESTLSDLETQMRFQRSVVVSFFSVDGCEIKKISSLKEFSALVACSKDPTVPLRKVEEERLQQNLLRIHTICQKNYDRVTQILHVDSQNISDTEACLLAKLLPSYPSLKEIRLSSNRIGDEGAKHIANALVALTSLRKLTLHGNPISAAAKHMLRGAARELHIELPYL